MPGHSLLELIVALALAGVLLGLAAPPVAQALAWARVRTARDLVAGEAARARALALARGGAALVVDLREGRAWVEAADTVTAAIDVAGTPPVRILADGLTGDTLRIAYDALGLGRLAGRTLRFRAAGREATLVVSQYGRLRW